MTLFTTPAVDLTGQVAIVTGGGRGLGQAMAQALAAAGAAVGIIARTAEQLEETAALIRADGGTVMTFSADIAEADQVTQMVEVVTAQLGPVTLLVNNAGLSGVPGPIWDSDPADWGRTLDVNLKGAYLCSRAVLKGMVARRQGRIINVASQAGLVPIPFGSSYCVSKAALLRLTECIAVDGVEHGIKAFAIDPGSVRTAMTAYLIESEAARKYMPMYREYIEAGNDVPPDLSARLVVQLASGRLDALSGRFLSVSDPLDTLSEQAMVIRERDLYALRLGRLPSGGNVP